QDAGQREAAEQPFGQARAAEAQLVGRPAQAEEAQCQPAQQQRQRGPRRGPELQHARPLQQDGGEKQPDRPHGRGHEREGGVHCPNDSQTGYTSWASRKTWSAMIAVTTTVAAAVVDRRLTSSPIRRRSRQNSSSGSSANGMPNDSTTWLSTSACVG